jgi:hypothetical protein
LATMPVWARTWSRWCCRCRAAAGSIGTPRRPRSATCAWRCCGTPASCTPWEDWLGDVDNLPGAVPAFVALRAAQNELHRYACELRGAIEQGWPDELISLESPDSHGVGDGRADLGRAARGSRWSVDLSRGGRDHECGRVRRLHALRRAANREADLRLRSRRAAPGSLWRSRCSRGRAGGRYGTPGSRGRWQGVARGVGWQSSSTSVTRAQGTRGRCCGSPPAGWR